MKYRIITLAVLAMCMAWPHTGMTAQTASSAQDIDALAVVIFKYNSTVNIWTRDQRDAAYEISRTGEMYRSFPTGPKVLYGDERIPEGIYRGRIDADGRVSFPFQTLPGLFEEYRITGASLDRNVIPLRGEVFDALTAAAAEQYAAGVRTIPVVILPGSLEPEVAERLAKARNVKPWQSLKAVEKSVQRWRPVEEALIRTGQIPRLRFDDGDIIIEEGTAPRGSLARQDGG